MLIHIENGIREMVLFVYEKKKVPSNCGHREQISESLLEPRGQMTRFRTPMCVRAA